MLHAVFVLYMKNAVFSKAKLNKMHKFFIGIFTISRFRPDSRTPVKLTVRGSDRLPKKFNKMTRVRGQRKIPAHLRLNDKENGIVC